MYHVDIFIYLFVIFIKIITIFSSFVLIDKYFEINYIEHLNRIS